MSSSAPASKNAPIPPWMATFADMMALMMTFFVLLFAYSKVEEEKFRQMAGSMAEAFGGVQYIQSNSDDATKGMEAGIMSKTGQTPIDFDPDSKRTVFQEVPAQTRNDELLKELKDALEQPLLTQSIVLEREGDDVVIRFPEHVSFASGSARLVSAAEPLIAQVIGLIPQNQYIVVSGHSDNRPVGGGEYSSNWALSAARAAAVAERIIALRQLNPDHIAVSGHADTRPIAPNDTPANRARNRRVEILVKSAEPARSEGEPTVDAGALPGAPAQTR